MEGISVTPPHDDFLPPIRTQRPQQQGMDYDPGYSSPESPNPEKPAPMAHPRQRDKRCFGPRLDEEAMLRDSNWCLYCCCGGCASTCTQLRPAQCACHMLCCTQYFHATSCCGAAGPCKLISDCLCCTVLCQVPPREGRPYCVVCSKPWCGYYGGNRARPDDDRKDWDFDSALDSGCTQCFCCCCCGFVIGLTAVSQHMWKCCCCECKNSTAAGCQLCGCLCSGMCCLGQFRVPCFSSPPNPCCACCGHRYRRSTWTPR